MHQPLPVGNIRKQLLLTISFIALTLVGMEVWRSAQYKALSHSDLPLRDSTLMSLSEVLPASPEAASKITVIKVWATWCYFCKEEAPELLTLTKRYRGDKINFLGITSEPNDSVRKYLDYKSNLKPVEDGYELVANQKRLVGLLLQDHFERFGDDYRNAVPIHIILSQGRIIYFFAGGIGLETRLQMQEVLDRELASI
jgi:thiol-disulfide isomerase/thioredoxin